MLSGKNTLSLINVLSCFSFVLFLFFLFYWCFKVSVVHQFWTFVQISCLSCGEISIVVIKTVLTAKLSSHGFLFHQIIYRVVVTLCGCCPSCRCETLKQELVTRWKLTPALPQTQHGHKGWHSLTDNLKAGPLSGPCARRFYPHPFHMVLLGEVLRGLTQPGLSKAIRANYRYPVTGALGQARWGAQRPYGRAGVNLGQKEKATLGPTLSECLPGSTNC